MHFRAVVGAVLLCALPTHGHVRHRFVHPPEWHGLEGRDAEEYLEVRAKLAEVKLDHEEYWHKHRLYDLIHGAGKASVHQNIHYRHLQEEYYRWPHRTTEALALKYEKEEYFTQAGWVWGDYYDHRHRIKKIKSLLLPAARRAGVKGKVKVLQAEIKALARKQKFILLNMYGVAKHQQEDYYDIHDHIMELKEEIEEMESLGLHNATGGFMVHHKGLQDEAEKLGRQNYRILHDAFGRCLNGHCMKPHGHMNRDKPRPPYIPNDVLPPPGGTIHSQLPAGIVEASFGEHKPEDGYGCDPFDKTLACHQTEKFKRKDWTGGDSPFSDIDEGSGDMQRVTRFISGDEDL